MRSGLLGLIMFCAASLVVGDAPAQRTETRIALIIANETYVASAVFQPLPGTQRDVQVMQDALARAGFEVTVLANQDRQQMLGQLGSFARRLSELGSSGVGFLYYSGHGVGQGAENYLIPVDAQMQGVTDLPVWGVAFSEQLEAISHAGARAAIIVLDACRTSFGRGSRGLVAVPTRTDTLVAFSTQPNELAADDGLYARMLAQEITRPGADSVTAFARVTSAVAGATQRAQIPRYENGLIDPVVFVPEGGVPPGPLPPAPALSAGTGNTLGVEQSLLARAQAAFVQEWRTADGGGSFSTIASTCMRRLDILSVSEAEIVWRDYNNRPPRRPNRQPISEISDALIQATEIRLFVPMRHTFAITGGHLIYSYGISRCDYIAAPH